MKDYDETTTEIHARRGEELAITLDAAAGGGYEWSVVEVPELLRLAREEDLGPVAEGIGGPARHRFVFRARGAGSAELTLAHGRSWDPEPERRLRIRVDVD